MIASKNGCTAVVAATAAIAVVTAVITISVDGKGTGLGCSVVFKSATAGDIVADPSAPNAFVNGIMESKEWVWDNGIIREADIADMQKEVKTASKSELENVKLKVFENFLSKL